MLRIDRLALEPVDGGALEHLALWVEARAVARAVPAALGAVPVDLAAEMGAAGGARDEAAVVTTVPRDLLPRQPHDVALAGLEVLDRAAARLGEAVAEEAQPDLGVLLDELRAPCAGVEAVGVEQRRPRVLAAHQAVGEHDRRGGAVRHPPLGEAGGHQHAPLERRHRAYVGHRVDRRAVLGGPAVLHRLDVPMLARELLERAVPLLRVAALAGLVALAAHEQQLLAVD